MKEKKKLHSSFSFVFHQKFLEETKFLDNISWLLDFKHLNTIFKREFK
jgi:hypothetical protein